MEIWVKYALVAAVFIAFRDIIMKDLSRKYSYVDYLSYALTFTFIGIWLYIYVKDIEPKRIEYKDLGVIIFRLLLIYVIIEPAIFYSLKHCKNTGEATSIISMNVIIAFALSLIFLGGKFSYKKLFGILIIMGGGYLVAS
jgi:uncharacterized membrane protein